MQTRRILQMMPGAGSWTLTVGTDETTLMPVTAWLLVRRDASDSDGWEEVVPIQPTGSYWPDAADERWDTVVHASHDDPMRAKGLADTFLKSEGRDCQCGWADVGWAFIKTHSARCGGAKR